MYSNQILVTILILVSVSNLTFAAKATVLKSIPAGTTNSTASTNTTPKEDISATRKGVNSDKPIITTRLDKNGIPEEQCQCTVFHLCTLGDVVNIPAESGKECPSQHVCCRVPLSTLYTTDEPGLSSVFNPDSIPMTSSSSSSQQPPTDGTESKCVCIPFYECKDYYNPSEKNKTSKIIPRISQSRCTEPDYCCRIESITSGGGNNSTTTAKPITSISEPSECGIRKPKIIERINAPSHLSQTSFGEFPWMALILTTEIAPNGTRNENVFVCGASLVAPSVVLTAAHCVFGKDKKLLRVRVGEYNTREEVVEPLNHQDRAVDDVRIPSTYNKKALYSDDLALIRVDGDFNFASHISPICTGFNNLLSTDPNSYNPSQCLATGWGKKILNEGNLQTTLKKVEFTLVPKEECRSRLIQAGLDPDFVLDSSFICAGGEPGFDTCQGDGGGPLVCATRDKPNKYIQVGVVSWGVGCSSDVPGVYASLEANKEWLISEFNSLTIFRRG